MFVSSGIWFFWFLNIGLKIILDILNLQNQHNELEAKFFEERAALEAKYQKLYEPLYTKVFMILTGSKFCIIFIDIMTFLSLACFPG